VLNKKSLIGDKHLKKTVALLLVLGLSLPLWGQTTYTSRTRSKRAHTAKTVRLAETFKGPNPWYDVTDPAWGAKCDGVTDDKAAIQAALTAANSAIHGGTVFVPSGGVAGPCVFASPLVMDNFTNVRVVTGTQGAWPGLAGRRANLMYTGTLSPAISARNCYGCTFDGTYLTASSTGFTGTLLSFDAASGGNGQTANSKVTNSLLSGPSGNSVGVLLSLDQAINIRIENAAFTNAKVAIRGAATTGSFSNTVSIIGPVSFGSGGACSISVADIQNPGFNWTITGNAFEIGNCSPGVQVIGMTSGFVGASGISFTSNFVGDQTGTDPTSTWFTIPPGASGWSFSGNTIGPLSTHSTIFSLGNNAAGVSISGNNFDSGSTIGTFLSLGTGTGVDVGPNSYGMIVTKFLSGTPVSGRIMDNTGKTTIYGVVAASTSLQVGAGTVFTGSQGKGTLILGNTATPPLMFGCTGAAKPATTFFLSGGSPCNLGSVYSFPLSAGSFTNLRCAANDGGVSFSDGVITVRKTGARQPLTCTLGTGTSCSDTIHSFTTVAGDRVDIQVTTQAATTLSQITCTLEKQ
jgi:hypothetical protein